MEVRTNEKRAKIICTLGPASNDYSTIRRLLLAGMDIARLNFSHGTHQEHAHTIAQVRKASRVTGRELAIMMDLQGPKIRVGKMVGGAVALKKGARLVITTRQREGDAECISTTYKGLVRDVKAGDVLLLDDGMIALRIMASEKSEVTCKVLEGGVLTDNKGINIPGAALSVEAIPRKDHLDVDFAISEGVDFIAMSFVRHPDDVRQLQRLLARRKAALRIVSKIEKPQAMDFIDDIIAISDAVMVARGDLGVEMDTEAIPGIQKSIIGKCNRQGVAVITATQMLESMMHNPRPTRAEASDVANAILDGTDAVMLSGESAAGQYPVEAVKMMRRITLATERAHHRPFQEHEHSQPLPVNEGIARIACQLAEQVRAKAIACVTLTGSMARSIAKYRPARQIYAISQYPPVARAVCINWGIHGIHMRDLTVDNFDDAVTEIIRELVARGHLKRGDRIVFTAGLPFSARQASNMVRVDEVGPHHLT